MRKKSFTLIEILVGALILALAFGGIFAGFIAVRKYVSHSNERLIAANLTRTILKNLYSQLGEDNWTDASGPFVDGKTYDLGTVTIDNFDYTMSYTVTGTTGDRKQIEVNITYPDIDL